MIRDVGGGAGLWAARCVRVGLHLDLEPRASRLRFCSRIVVQPPGDPARHDDPATNIPPRLGSSVTLRRQPFAAAADVDFFSSSGARSQ
jgi:hypothetical protein